MEDHQFTVECSPNSFIKLQNDTQFVDEMIEDVPDSDPLDYIENSCDYSQAKGDDDNFTMQEDEEFDKNCDTKYSEENPPTDVWFEAPTKLLLSCMDEMQPKVGKSFALKNKSKMWVQIHKILAEEGYTFTVAQVQGRFRSLERRYKQTKLLERSNSDRKRQPFLYESEVEKIIGKKKGVRSEFILESKELAGNSREILVGATVANEKNSTYSSGIEDSDGPVIKRRKKTESSHERLCKCLQNIDKRQVDYNKEMLKILKKKNEIEERRNEILEKICEKMTKP